MYDDYIHVVGVAFIKKGKLLISMSKRSAKSGKYTLVGGGVEEIDETIKHAARRECQEEIANGFDIQLDELKEILVFREPALSDPNLMAEMHLFLALKEVDVELIPNDEIIEFKWFTLGDDESMLSSTITDHILPYARENNLMY